MGSGRYDMTMHLVEYGDANFASDVEIYDVISPNNWEYVSRKNTIWRIRKLLSAFEIGRSRRIPEEAKQLAKK